jgi:hypothetical protein
VPPPHAVAKIAEVFREAASEVGTIAPASVEVLASTLLPKGTLTEVM